MSLISFLLYATRLVKPPCVVALVEDGKAQGRTCFQVGRIQKLGLRGKCISCIE